MFELPSNINRQMNQSSRDNLSEVQYQCEKIMGGELKLDHDPSEFDNVVLVCTFKKPRTFNSVNLDNESIIMDTNRMRYFINPVDGTDMEFRSKAKASTKSRTAVQLTGGGKRGMNDDIVRTKMQGKGVQFTIAKKKRRLIMETF